MQLPSAMIQFIFADCNLGHGSAQCHASPQLSCPTFHHADPAADAAALGAAKRKRVQLEGGLEYEHGDDGGGLQVCCSSQPGLHVDSKSSTPSTSGETGHTCRLALAAVMTWN
jgi:hypothetical protein